MKRLLFKILYPFIRFYWKTFQPRTQGSRAILLYEGEILLVKHINADYWSLPGGGIDKGETPEQCVLRELREELNISNTKIEYKLGEYTSNNEGKQDTVHIFIVTTPSPDFTRHWELDDAEWFRLDNIPENLSPASYRRIGEYRNGKKNLISDW